MPGYGKKAGSELATFSIPGDDFLASFLSFGLAKATGTSEV